MCFILRMILDKIVQFCKKKKHVIANKRMAMLRMILDKIVQFCKKKKHVFANERMAMLRMMLDKGVARRLPLTFSGFAFGRGIRSTPRSSTVGKY